MVIGMPPGTLAMNSVSAGQSANCFAPKCGGPQNGLFANNAIIPDCFVTWWIEPETVRIEAKSPRATDLNSNGCVAKASDVSKATRNTNGSIPNLFLRISRGLRGSKAAASWSGNGQPLHCRILTGD